MSGRERRLLSRTDDVPVTVDVIVVADADRRIDEALAWLARLGAEDT
jgi:hypothetical protein